MAAAASGLGSAGVRVARAAWSLLLSHPVGQLTTTVTTATTTTTTTTTPSATPHDSDEQEPDNPVARSNLVAHACEVDVTTHAPYSILRAVWLALPPSAAPPLPSAPSLAAAAVNYAVGHTNPAMARRFRQVGLTVPRISVTGQARAVAEGEMRGLFQRHFSQHPLLLKHSRAGPTQWRLYRLEPAEAYYVDVSGRLVGIPTLAERQEPLFLPPLEIAQATNQLMAKLNSLPPSQLATLCAYHHHQKPLGAAPVGAFLYHVLDDHMGAVMGSHLTPPSGVQVSAPSPLTWASVELPYQPAPRQLASQKELLAYFGELLQRLHREQKESKTN